MSDKKPIVMITEFPDGVVIGWDYCAIGNGGCGKRVNMCACKTGPHEPKIFNQWRTGEKIMPDYGKASRPTTPEPKVSPVIQAAVAAAADATQLASDDPRVLDVRISSLESLADEELATNGKTERFNELSGKLEALYKQRQTTEVPA